MVSVDELNGRDPVREWRATCPRCRRPESHCYCALIPSLTPKTRVVIVQHPRERDVAIGTARMVHLGLRGSALVPGVAVDDKPALADVLADPSAAVLFPSDDAKPLADWLRDPPRTLVVVDGTWSQARKVLRMSPRLGALPRVSFTPSAPGNYRIRKEPSEECLATVEAVAAVLGALEGDVEGYRALLRPFTAMVDRQVDAAAQSVVGRHRVHKIAARVRDGRPLQVPKELFPLLDDPASAVLIYGEANAHPRALRSIGSPEIVHLMAARDGRTFEARIKPRRALPDEVPHRLGLDR
ncbi:MAG TPA: tRNA-uridine aminocarboxypropyltransferase [Myxococcota bacterium]